MPEYTMELGDKLVVSPRAVLMVVPVEKVMDVERLLGLRPESSKPAEPVAQYPVLPDLCEHPSVGINIVRDPVRKTRWSAQCNACGLEGPARSSRDQSVKTFRRLHG
jgi:hypothetical protein